jgi:hypothetical protein
VAGNAQQSQHLGEAIEKYEEDLCGDDAIDEAGEEALRDDGVFFYELGEVV